MDSVDPFDCLYQINAAQKRPPPVSRFFHKGIAFEPVFGVTGRAIASEMPSVDFEIQQFQPVSQTREADEFGIGRQKVGTCQFTDTLAQSP